jgi:hypothetical protein
MFEGLFALVGPVGSAAALLTILIVLFAVGAAETARLARTDLGARRALVAPALAASDSRSRHGTSFCALVRHSRLGELVRNHSGCATRSRRGHSG